ncbi:DUF4139 domain-containing protein [Marinobacterium sp. YM272]|uniref:DUF4139 domain-containing protein n=1 Tax=Marinobacterium sp. YM272 TaxID=3421654 RepID=UPI003D7FFED5
MFFRKHLGLIGLAIISQAAAAAPDLVLDADARSSRTLTIYQQDLALFTETYPLNLNGAGPAEVRLDDISNRLLPDSIFATGIGDLRRIELSAPTPGFTQRLRSLQGEQIELVFQPASGKARSREVTLIYVEPAGIQVTDGGATEFIPFDGPWQIRLPGSELPAEGPQLSLRGSGAPGDQLNLSYLSNGLSWQAGYQLEMLPDGKRVRLEGRASLSNNTSTDLDNARVRLLAGSVNQPNGGRTPMYALAASAEMRSDAAPKREALEDYQLYPLPEPVTLKQGGTVSVPLLAPLEMDVTSRYLFTQQVYGGAQQEAQIGHPRRDISFTLPNDEARDVPLPAGSARVYQDTEAHGLIFVGGQQLRATAAGEEVRLTLGEAFDLTVEQTQTRFERQGVNTVVGYRISIRNSGDEDRSVEYRAVFSQPRILLESSEAGEEQGAIHYWQLDIPAGGEKVLEYSARLLRN